MGSMKLVYSNEQIYSEKRTQVQGNRNKIKSLVKKSLSEQNREPCGLTTYDAESGNRTRATLVGDNCFPQLCRPYSHKDHQ